ncbi:hypothetical protein P3L10_015300 [Capsicum annuum]
MRRGFQDLYLLRSKLLTSNDKYEKYVLTRHLDDKVGTLHLRDLQSQAYQTFQDQADYISIPVVCPYKHAHYRY